MDSYDEEVEGLMRILSKFVFGNNDGKDARLHVGAYIVDADIPVGISTIVFKEIDDLDVKICNCPSKVI